MFSLEPKALGAFVQYTLKPLIDDARELIDVMEEKGFKKDDLKYAYRLMIWQNVLGLIQTVIVTGAICLTLYAILSHSQNIVQ